MDKFLVIATVIILFQVYNQWVILRAVNKKKVEPKKVLDNLNETLEEIKDNTQKVEKQIIKRKIDFHIDEDWMGWVLIIGMIAGGVLGVIIGVIL